ncbi:chromate transporter [Pseudorhodoferax sp.]|uniref:chromate transporter n=1 Tax=Pseudorhodoferax sp. TaxID=1993553 RepID=UPI002DD6754D|nr:chromate transporter [Pseudorhodoferax sp.]
MNPGLQALLLGPGRLGAPELAAMFVHFMMLSLLAVGGAITTTSDMQRWVVGERGWLSDGQFTASVALAQAAPGPNLLFVAVIGWNVAGLAGTAATLFGSLLPSTTLALLATRWGTRNAGWLGLRAFKAGMAPLSIGLLLATGWVLTEPLRSHALVTGLLVLMAVAVMVWTKLSPLWAIVVGAVVGAMGLLG